MKNKLCRAYEYPGGRGKTQKRHTLRNIGGDKQGWKTPEVYSAARENMARARESARLAIRAGRKVPARQAEEQGAGADRSQGQERRADKRGQS